MSTFANCPPTAAPPDITIPLCLEQFGQVAKIAGQRVRQADGTRNKFVVATNDIKLLASWTPLLTSATDTKIQVTPKVHGVNGEAGEIIEDGGGDDTVGGVPITVGIDRSEFNGVFIQQPASVIRDLKGWQSEVAFGHYLINKDGYIGCLADDTETPTEYYPIPASSWVIRDKQFGGFTSYDRHDVRWYYEPNWSDNFVVVKPTDFNGLTDLLNS